MRSVEEYEQRLADLAREVHEAKQAGDVGDFHDACEAYICVAAAFRRAYPPKTPAQRAEYIEAYRAREKALAVEEGRA